jgi:MarR family transcriptional regulator, organic hydroperoxide resistance regulator
VSTTRDHELALLLRQADRRVSARLGAILTARGSSLDQWHVLSYLSDGAGHAMSEIGAVLMVPAPSMSKLIDGMVSRSLVYRRVDAADRRRVLVFLAARGRRLHDDLGTAVAQHETELQELYGAAGLDALTTHLAALIARLDTVASGPTEVAAPA